MNNIRLRREALNMTQEKLAELAKIDRGYLSEIENGKANPTQKILVKLAKALGVEPRDLI